MGPVTGSARELVLHLLMLLVGRHEVDPRVGIRTFGLLPVGGDVEQHDGVDLVAPEIVPLCREAREHRVEDGERLDEQTVGEARTTVIAFV